MPGDLARLVAGIEAIAKGAQPEDDPGVFKFYNVKTWVSYLETPTGLTLLELELSKKFQVGETSSIQRRGAFRAVMQWAKAVAERQDWMESELEQLGEQLLFNLRNIISIEKGVDPTALASKVEELVEPGDTYASKVRPLEKPRQLEAHIATRGAKRCLACGKPGHFARNCWIKHPELRPAPSATGAPQTVSKRLPKNADAGAGAQ